jgi:DNA-binding transcriptional regulator GbsR (MarR family)
LSDVAPAAAENATGRVVARLAAMLTDAGFPRMPARVFVALLCTDSGRLTASELATAVQGSAGAVSGAVR